VLPTRCQVQGYTRKNTSSGLNSMMLWARRFTQLR
jgi:hypothetical protein